MIPPKSRIYLAARYSRRDELNKYAATLSRFGHVVTSRWLNGTHEIPKNGSDQADDAWRTRFALDDFEDVVSSNVVISFTEEPRKTTTRGGRHVEFGAAIALGKECYVVGHRENVFHHLPKVNFFENFEELLEAIKS